MMGFVRLRGFFSGGLVDDRRVPRGFRVGMWIVRARWAAGRCVWVGVIDWGCEGGWECSMVVGKGRMAASWRESSWTRRELGIEDFERVSQPCGRGYRSNLRGYLCCLLASAKRDFSL